MEYDFEEERIVEEIRKRNARRVLVQLPEGLKKEAFKILENVKGKTKAELIFSGRGCWGGCDLAVEEAKKIKADLLIHFGHAPLVKSDFPIVYIELYSKLNIVDMLEKEIKKLDIKKIGLIGSVQFIRQFDRIKIFLESHGKEIIIPKKKGFSAYDGHVVGCEYNLLKGIENEVDGFLVVGNRFHSLGAALMCADKKVFLLNEQNGKIELMNNERDKTIRKRAIAIDKVKQAKKIGVIVDKKIGQYNMRIAENLRNDFEKVGKQAIIIIVDEFNPSVMNFYDVDAFIDTACPRIAFEDFEKYDKIMITSREAKVALGKLSWDELLEKGLIGFA